jgi:Flp pilus assembly protein CpaB
MAGLHYTAIVKGERLLELPEEAEALRLQPGEEVSITLDRNGEERTVLPNERMLAVMRRIAERQKGRPYTDGTDTLRLLREARAGAMYGDDLTG